MVAEPTFVATMKDYPTIIGQLFQAAVGRGLSEMTRIIAPGDGGIGLMEEMQSQFPGIQYILDRPHLKSHLYDTGRALGLGDEMTECWVERKMILFDKGQAGTALEQMQQEYEACENERLRRLIKHVTRFKDCISYHSYIAEGWPIGSGEIESAHRYIPQERLKLPGAWWHPDNVDPMLALRVARANDWWEDYWLSAARQPPPGEPQHDSLPIGLDHTLILHEQVSSPYDGLSSTSLPRAPRSAPLRGLP